MTEGDTHSQLHLTECHTWEAEADGQVEEAGVIQIPTISAKRSRILCSQLKQWKSKRKRPPLRRNQKNKTTTPRAYTDADAPCSSTKGHKYQIGGVP